MVTEAATKLDAYQQIAGFLKANNVERDEDIELLMLSMISGVDALFLGEPGVGKTHMIELLVNHCITDAQLFTHLFAKDQSADEVLGPRDIMAMKAGRVGRLTDGFMPTAHFAFADELFKASPPMLNPLLDLLANRVLKVGGRTVDCSQLIAIFASSNELPDREDLLAFRDRIGITKVVHPVRTPESRRRVTDIQLDHQANGVDTSNLTPLSLDDIHAIRAEVNAIKVPDSVRDAMVTAQQKWTDAGHAPSQRRVGQMWRAIKANAWSRGRSEAITEDLLVCQHMAWNDPDDAASAREVVLEFAGAFQRKAQRAREALEPIAASMEEFRAKLDAAKTEDEREELATGEGFKLLRQLRKLRSDVTKQIHEGEQDGQDVTPLAELSNEITQLGEWAERALIGDMGD